METSSDGGSSWQACTNGDPIASANSQTIQFRASLSTGDPSQTPTLHDVTITYRLNQPPVVDDITGFNPPNGGTIPFAATAHDPDALTVARCDTFSTENMIASRTNLDVTGGQPCWIIQHVLC